MGLILSDGYSLDFANMIQQQAWLLLEDELRGTTEVRVLSQL